MPFDFIKRADKSFQQRKRNIKLQSPIDRFGNFRRDNRRQRRMNSDGAAQFNWDSDELFEAAGRAFGIGDVAREKCPAAIEFEIEIAFVGFWLEEKFYASILPNFVAISGSHAPNKAVFNFKNSVDSRRIVKQSNLGAWVMFAGFFAEKFYF